MSERKLEVERSTSTAHRLKEYDGVCGCVHGHNMKWEITLIVSMEDAGSDNMPLDFKEVSDMVDETDHAILLNDDDPLLDREGMEQLLGDLITFDGDPTCELISEWMAERFVDEIPSVLDAEVTIYETDKYGMTAKTGDGEW